MPPVTLQRRVTSTPTTVTVSESSPSWLPDKGSWSTRTVSLNSPSSITTATGPWSAGRTLEALFTDYTGAIWNPYYGSHGAWILHGGGHSNGSVDRNDNGVYAWDAGSRRWVELRAPTYPGTMGASFWPGGAAMWASQPTMGEPMATYGELEVGIPCSNHSRWTMGVLPPGKGGSSAGSIVLTQLSSGHTGGNIFADQSKIFDCVTRSWSRFGPNGPTTDHGPRHIGCVDSVRGRVIKARQSSIYWIDAINPIAWSANRAPPGFYGSGYENRPMIYCPELDAFIILNYDYTFAVFTADELYSSGIPRLSARPPIVSNPSTVPAKAPAESIGLTWCKDLGTYGAFVCLEYVSPYRVFACYAPSNPITGTWTWAVLSSSNSPSFNWTGFDGNVGKMMYSKFQYAPTLKAFFVCALPSQNMLCFRPSEII